MTTPFLLSAPAIAGLLPARIPARLALDSVVVSDALDFLRGLPDACVDLIVTSPPYDNLRTYKGYSWDFEGIAREAYRVIKQGGVMVWVVGDSVVDGSESLTSFKQALYFKECVGFRMHDTMIYSRAMATKPLPNRYYQTFDYMFVFSKGPPRVANLIEQLATRDQSKSSSVRSIDGTTIKLKYAVGKETRVLSNVWTLNTGYNHSSKDCIAFEHPAIFPEELARRHIVTWSNPGDVVCDFFMGSGTTAKIARALGRHYIGCDISAEYVAIARQRLAAPYTPDMFAALEPLAPAAEQARIPGF